MSAALKRAIIDQSVAKTRMPHIVKCHYSRLLTLLGGRYTANRCFSQFDVELPVLANTRTVSTN